MIPQGGSLQANQNIEQQPSYTYRVDFATNRISRHSDGLEAIKQAVFKILQTERFQHLIYTSNYGVELNSLVGKSRPFVQSEIKRRIKEALLQDDRIIAIEGMLVTFNGDQALVEFVVVTQYGSFRQEVRRNV